VRTRALSTRAHLVHGHDHAAAHDRAAAHDHLGADGHHRAR
jgi:hypothetical protein